jgi:hypothetical protein
MVTYSSIRYAPSQDDPQILSAIDETNLALKQVLGFTVGYYGSVLQVTGNYSYGQTMAANYLNSGLANIANMRPEWGTSFNIENLSLSTNWFMNESFSQGSLKVNYSLTGLGVSGITYSATSRLDVQISPSNDPEQVCLSVFDQQGTPISGLVLKNFKFYLYQYSNLTWQMTPPPCEPVSFSNGTYLVNITSGINPMSYSIQVQDTRGIMVSASSFSHYTGTLTFNSSFVPDGQYVNFTNPKVDGLSDVGTHSSFPAQQQAPDSVYDTMNSANVGTQLQNYYPDSFAPSGSTSVVSGSLANLTADDGVYMTLKSYASAYSPGQYTTTTYDNSASGQISSGTSLSWSHTTGAGNDRILLVSVDAFTRSGAPTTVSSVFYGPTQITQSLTSMDSGTRVRSYVYYLLNPDSGTKTIAVTFGSSTVATGGSVSYSNVNQTSPIAASNVANGTGASSQTISLNALGSYSKLLFGHMASQATSSYTANDNGGGQQNRWSQTGSYSHGGTNYYYQGRGSDKSVTSGSVNVGWTTTASVNWAGIAVLLQPTQLPSQETLQVVYSGPSNTFNWNNLTTSIDASASANVGFTLQLYNYTLGNWSPSGSSGYYSGAMSASNKTQTLNVTANPITLRDSIGRWQLNFTVVQSTSTPFTVSFDVARYRTGSAIYALGLEEQWVNLNYTDPHPQLCIDTGALGPATLALDVWYSGAWHVLSASLSPGWNNMSISTYVTSPTFTVRFRSDNSLQPSSWQVDAALIRPESDRELFASLQDSSAVVTLELLQNGTMVWLGQSLQLSSQTIPIPPVPVKDLQVKETINGVSSEVPFQVEDWSSAYTVPLGLTDNATVFGNRQMVVFLITTQVSDFTVWWNGSDQVVQTPLAYTNQYFNDNPPGNTISNGKLSLSIGGGFTVTSTVVSTGTTSTSTFMRIDNQASVYGSSAAYVIVRGVVRDVIQQEAEWAGGAPNCPNVYANIVLTLPAHAAYYTYQLRLMFLSSNQPRTISDLCPIKLSTSINQIQTENGTILSDPIVVNDNGITYYYNQPAGTMHHFSQFISGSHGAGIMFTDSANQQLYRYDSMAGGVTGALKTSTTAQTIELMPVSTRSVSFLTAMDMMWQGAVATFDGTTPIYAGQGQPGLWILAELPPTMSVVTGN